MIPNQGKVCDEKENLKEWAIFRTKKGFRCVRVGRFKISVIVVQQETSDSRFNTKDKKNVARESISTQEGDDG